MKRILVVIALVTGVLGVPAQALAYELRGFDPDDRAAVGADPDIRSSILRVEPGKSGRFLVLVVRTYEEFGVWWSIEARLDARGGLRADHILALWNWDISAIPPSGCSIREAGAHEDARWGGFRQRGNAVRCRVPIRLLDPDKQIRWRFESQSSYDEGELERAPNTGWYG